MEEKQLTYAEKINKLLRKAESTTEAEAEALIAKAQELMMTWAIDEAMLAKARGEEIDEIVKEAIPYRGSYKAATWNIGEAVADAQNLKVLYRNDYNAKMLVIVGYKSDVERFKMLDASLQIQAASALNAWWKTQQVHDWWTASDKFKAKRDFLFGFASGLHTKFNEANRLARQSAAEAEAERENVTQEVASESVGIVLRSKRERVDDWYDKKYGKPKAGRGGSYTSGYGGGWSAGHSAGKSANTGQPGIGARKSLTS